MVWHFPCALGSHSGTLTGAGRGPLNLRGGGDLWPQAGLGGVCQWPLWASQKPPMGLPRALKDSEFGGPGDHGATSILESEEAKGGVTLRVTQGLLRDIF